MKDINNKCVYKHIRLDTNEVFYIGIGTEKRPYSIGDRSSFWRKTANKAGYKVEIVSKDLSWEEAKQLEMYLIKFYGRRDSNLGTLVNHTDGGEGKSGHICTEETRKKLSEGHKGFKFSEESKLKMSQVRKGIKFSEEHLKNLSIAGKGKHSVPNTKPFSAQGRQNMSDASTTALVVLDTINGIFYNSIIEASKYQKYSITSLQRMLRGDRLNKTNLIFA